VSRPKSERKLTLPTRTARLNLREFVKSDFDAIYAYSSDPRVTRYLFFGPRDQDSTADYLEDLLASQVEVPRTRFELAVEEIESGRVIGACDLSLIERSVVDLGYMLGLQDWGKGYATEIALALVDAAFLDLRADRIISTVDVNNSASIRVLEKIGMRWEAVFRKHRRAKNRWWDCHLFVLPREVWEFSCASRNLSCASRG
jgi:[ribosomal protein S5]-alanine N-acetyltransferase